MNLLCPGCQQTVTAPDESAGHQMNCPLCGTRFQAPSLAGAPASAAGTSAAGGSHSASPVADAVALATPVPELNNRVNSSPGGGTGSVAPSESSPAPHATPPEPAGHPRHAAPPPLPPLPGHGRLSFAINPAVGPWVAPASLVAVFILLFFPWLTVPATTATQPRSYNAWELAFSGESLSALLIVYVLVMTLLTVPAALASLGWTLNVIPHDHLRPNLKPWVAMRTWIVLGLGLLELVFLGLQLFIGFGTETAAWKPATADGYIYYLMHRTVWLSLAVVFNVLAVLGALFEDWLERHGRQPVRVTLTWDTIPT